MEKSIESMKRARQLRSLKWKMEPEEREYFDKKTSPRCKRDGTQLWVSSKKDDVVGGDEMPAPSSETTCFLPQFRNGSWRLTNGS
uniref:Uncharacterized protein n=1 Tax=Physcomitrium patens TaxID=3218 RepID=A0A2K1IFB6_PHYPA|nr:hypothetical protein PHYPA_028557 [Physcomitrium patens]